MNKKKIAILVCILFMMFSLGACGNAKEDEFAVTQQESSMQVSESVNSKINDEKTVNIDSEIKKDEDINTENSSINQQESSPQVVESIDQELTSEELLDLFINGSIDAIDSKDMNSKFNIADFNIGSEGWDSYSIGEKIDLDNDGENELIICGTYGGIYLDARENKVYVFAIGDGNANILSYTYYNGEIWIMYSNSMNEGYECYHMEKYEGADNLVAEMSFSAELVDANNPEAGTKYLLNGNEISYDEYTTFGSKIFAAEESTN
ncbi:MAG: hypothetical protein K1W41_21740 [Lachnospiraceae bacterium]